MYLSDCGQPLHDGRSNDSTEAASFSHPRKENAWQVLVEAQNAPADWKELLTIQFSKLMQDHPRAQELLRACEKSAEINRELLLECKVPHAESALHGDDHLVVQSFAMMLGTLRDSGTLCHGVRTRGTHLIDDEIDRKDKEANRNLFASYSGDFKGFLHNWGPLGKFSQKLGHIDERAPADFFRGLERMIYGGLLAHCRIPEFDDLAKKYKEISTKGLDARLVSAIEDIPRECYILTSKTVLEMFPLDGSDNNANELRSICFAPGVLLIDLPAEVETQEINLNLPAPTIDGLVGMIDTARECLTHGYAVNYQLFHDQFRFVTEAFAMMYPRKIKDAYCRFEEDLIKHIEAGRN